MIPGLVFLTATLPAVTAPETSPIAVDAQPIVTMVTPAEATIEATGPVEVKWTGSVNIGASYSDGNTDSRAINAAFDAERRAEKDRHTVKGYWNYAEQRDSAGEFGLSARRSGLTYKYDYFLSKQIYAFGIAGIESDTLADISKRYYAGGGIGYQWRETDELKWGSEAGLTYFKTDYKVSEDTDYIAARLANNVAWQINEQTKLENNIELFPSVEDLNDFYGKSDTKVKTNLSKTMFAQLQWIYQFQNRPATGKERNDNLLVLGVGWSF